MVVVVPRTSADDFDKRVSLSLSTIDGDDVDDDSLESGDAAGCGDRLYCCRCRCCLFQTIRSRFPSK